MLSSGARVWHVALTLFLYQTRQALASPKDIWHISILEAPAPPPEKGPPLQASALRKKSYLPAQIASILAAYVLSLLFIGSAILFVGRRLRRAAQGSPKTLAMEMVKPNRSHLPQSFDPSPVSPALSKSIFGPSPAETFDMKNNWPSPIKNRNGSSTWGSFRKGHKKQQQSVQSSVVSFDESVIAEDRDRNEREMERLYAAVVEHDEIKAASVTELPDHGLSQHPPELQHLYNARPSNALPTQNDTEIPSRVPTRSPRTTHRPTPISIHSPTSVHNHNSSRSSLASVPRKRGIRSLPISPPMGSPGIVPDHVYDEAEPLTPRIYDDPGPPPPTPPQQKKYFNRDERLSPCEARFPSHPISSLRSPGSSLTPIQSIPETRQASIPSQEPARSRRTPVPLALRTAEVDRSGALTQNRKAPQTAPLPLRNPYPTNLNHDRTEPTIKATVLETGAPGPNLRTPHTGVPMTPYSPYMPFTPLTPMTPGRLVTRTERKRKEKEEGRRVVTAEDAVIEEDDTWGNAYP